MRVSRYVLGAGITAAALTLAACAGSSGSGSGSGSNSGSSADKPGGTISVVEGTAPDSLDPDYTYVTQSLEADDMVYLPLVAYAAKSGTAGTQLIPGLAKALPTVSSDQKTYTMQLRSGLKYSDGTPVKASDFAHAIERSCRINWGGKSFFTSYIQGAAAYDGKKANSISGITTDDSTGKITIKLTTPYGAFSDILAFEAAAPIPSSTPMKVLSANPPIGDGPYKFGKIVPNATYQLVKNTSFAAQKIPGVPTGYANTINVTKNSNTATESQSVLNNQYDLFDPGDTIAPGVLPSLATQAKGRYKKVPLASSYYFFLNTKVAPFNNPKVRAAVNMATDRTALARLSSGALTPGCYFLPPSIVGHNDGGCPSVPDPAKVPSAATVAKAKAIIKAAGDDGKKVTVWGELRDPRTKYVNYFAALLKSLGFDAAPKIVQDTVYFETIGNLKLHPQTGFADWSQDFPDPSDFYLLLAKAGIQAENNENFDEVNDPKIESQLATLNPVPATQLSSVQGKWQQLEKYVASQNYFDVYGYETAPEFMSNKVDFNKAVFNPVYYVMFSTMELKK